MLDIKLKNGEGNSAKLTGLVLVLSAAIIFTAFIPEFKEKAEVYYKKEGNESVESEEFIRALVQSNYVFYKNVLDKSGAETYSYEELFLQEQVEEPAYNKGEITSEREEREYAQQLEDLQQKAFLKNAEVVQMEQFQGILGIYAGQMERTASEVELSYVEDIGKNMDYYVLDKGSHTELKNTSLPIESLLDSEKAEDASDLYDYYIMMDYDRAGNLVNVAVKGFDSDKLLKTVQTVEKSRYGFLLPTRNAVEVFAFYDSVEEYWEDDVYVGEIVVEESDKEDVTIEKLLTLSQKKPVDATFIYAMTAEQLAAFQNRGYAGAYLGRDYGPYPLYYSYSQAGVVYMYMLFMAAIFVIVMLLALCKSKLVAGREKRKMPIEIVLPAAFILIAATSEIVLMFVASAGTGAMLDWFNDNFPVSVSMGKEYAMLVNGISFCFFALLFGGWYYCCLELSDILYNVKHYIQTRSLIYKLCTGVLKICRKYYRKLKKEVFSLDLSDDMSHMLRKVLFINFCLLATACLLWLFGIFGLLIYIFALYCFLKKYIYKIQAQYETLLEATNSIAEGNLNNDFEEDFGIFESYKEELYKVQDGFKKAVEEEVKSQRMKTELITNVSHDLKTPLTAIITYTDLLKDENITKEQREEYLETLERKSLRLKILIEDLFEVSKANSGNVNLEPVPVDICHLMKQVYLEQEEKMKQAGLHVRFIMPEEKVILDLDSQKTYRIFENLYTNIVKYAMPDTRVFVTAQRIENTGKDRDGIHIELKNISAQEIIGNPQELSERFVRGDSSRNTEGSGLGLAIAKSLTELQGGSFKIETDGDLFKVVLIWS